MTVSVAGLNSATLLEALENRHGIDPQLVNEHLVPLLHSFLPNPPQAPAPAPEANAPPPPPPPFPSTHVPPIPFVQNEMGAVEGCPKRQNVARPRGRRGGWRRFWRTAWDSRLALLLPVGRQRRRYDPAAGQDERRRILVTPTSSSLSEPPTPLSPCHQTRVLIANGAPHTVISAGPPALAHTEIGIAQLHRQPGLAPVVRSRPGSKDSGINKSSENSNVSFLDSESSLERVRRPTSLHLPVGRPPHAASEEDLGSDGERTQGRGLEPEVKLRKPKRRVKTPRRPLMPRLSLYDDSVMAGGAAHLTPDVGFSRSLPLEIDRVGEAKGGSSSLDDAPPSEMIIQVRVGGE